MSTMSLYEILKVEGRNSFSILIYGVTKINVCRSDLQELFPEAKVWFLGEETDRTRVVLLESEVEKFQDVPIRVITLLHSMVSIPEIRVAFAMADGVYDGISTVLDYNKAEFIYAIAENSEKMSYAYHDVIRKGDSWKSAIQELKRRIDV